MVRGHEPAGTQRVPGCPALDHQKGDVGPAAAQLLGDPIRLRQVLSNLTDNAIKFTKEGSVVIRVFLEDRQEASVTLPGDDIPEQHVLTARRP